MQVTVYISLFDGVHMGNHLKESVARIPVSFVLGWKITIDKILPLALRGISLFTMSMSE